MTHKGGTMPHQLGCTYCSADDLKFEIKPRVCHQCFKIWIRLSLDTLGEPPLFCMLNVRYDSKPWVTIDVDADFCSDSCEEEYYMTMEEEDLNAIDRTA